MISFPSSSKCSSTLPWFLPFLSNSEPDISPLLVPNSAKSIAYRIVDFPAPMSPDKRREPSEKLISSSMYDLIFFRISFFRIISLLPSLHCSLPFPQRNNLFRLLVYHLQKLTLAQELVFLHFLCPISSSGPNVS